MERTDLVDDSTSAALLPASKFPFPPYGPPPCTRPSFLRTQVQAFQNLDIKGTPRLMNSPFGSLRHPNSPSQPLHQEWPPLLPYYISVEDGDAPPPRVPFSTSSVFRSPALLAASSTSRYPSSRRPWATRQHYLRAGYGLHQFARLTLFPMHVRDVPEYQHTSSRPAQSSTQMHPPALATARPHPCLEALQRRRATRVLPHAQALHRRRRCMSRAASWHTIPRTTRDDAHAVCLSARARPIIRARTSASALLYTRIFGVDATGLQHGAARRGAGHARTSIAARGHASLHVLRGLLAAPARACLTHLALPHFVCVPSAAHDVPPTASPRFAVLDNGPGLASALVLGRPLTA